MFKQACYIEKNTLELRKQIEELGYKYGGKERTYGEAKALYCHYDKFYECFQKPSRYESIVNCEDNEDLFLAIAALQDDTDKGQWMICKYHYNFPKYNHVQINDWVMCTEKKCLPLLLGHFKKATVKEIIKHFKK